MDHALQPKLGRGGQVDEKRANRGSGQFPNLFKKGVDEFGAGEVLVDAFDAVMTEANTFKSVPGFSPENWERADLLFEVVRGGVQVVGP